MFIGNPTKGFVVSESFYKTSFETTLYNVQTGCKHNFYYYFEWSLDVLLNNPSMLNLIVRNSLSRISGIHACF